MVCRRGSLASNERQSAASAGIKGWAVLPKAKKRSPNAVARGLPQGYSASREIDWAIYPVKKARRVAGFFRFAALTA